MPRYRLVIFDFDGTLADSVDWFVGAFNQAAQTFGLRAMAEAELDTLRGYDTRALIRHFEVPMWKLPLLARHMRLRQAEIIESIRPFPGIRDTLIALAQAGVELAVVSSNARANVIRVLGPNVAERIAHYGCGASLLGKAAKFRAVVKASGVQPQQVIAIGDEIRDIEAARQVGIAAGAVAWGYAHFAVLRDHSPAEAFLTVDEMRERLLAP